MIILKNTTEPQDVMIQRPNPDNDIQRNAYLKSSDLKTLNNESLVGTGNISIPVVTKTSQLINDSGFIGTEGLDAYALKTDIPTKTSQLTNDSGYIDSTALDGYAKTSDVNTELEKKADKSSIPTKTSDLTNDSDYTTKQYVDSSISTALGTVENKLSLI